MTTIRIGTWPQCYRTATLLLVLFGTAEIRAQQTVSLIDAADAAAGWKFNNGAEFPGATGAVVADPEVKRAGGATLKLIGDFTKGGGYVDAGRKIDGVDIRELSFWVRNLQSDKFSLRINDASGQTHQIVMNAEPQSGWQRLVLPLEKFFARRGEADAVTSIAKYESWGGAKDGLWHGPATSIYFLIPNPRDVKVHTLWFSEIAIQPRPAEVPGAELKSLFPLDEILEGSHDWRFTRGEEFPGAKGSLTIVKDAPAVGQSCFRMAGDFTGGGAYVAAVKNVQDLGAKDVTAVRLKLKSDNAQSIGIQFVDSAGQTHQRKGVKVTADGKWHDVVIKPTEIAGGEHWGGPNDGQWRGPLAQLVISLSNESDPKSKQPILQLAEIRAEALLPVFAQPAAFKSDFESAELSPEWIRTENVSIDAKIAFQRSRSLALARKLADVDKPCHVTSPRFPLASGRWDFNFAAKSDLHSPDNSYQAVVQLECLDNSGKVVDQVLLAELFGKRDWKRFNHRADLRPEIVAGRFRIQLNKTYGSFWLDDISASYLAPSTRKDDRIARVLFATAQLGNLLFPGDPRTVSITIETRKPLRDSQRAVSLVVRDYWGAEQTSPVTVMLGTSEKKEDRFHYQSSIDLGDMPLEIGRYYELHATIPQDGEEPFHNHTSFAILPEAVTRKFKPEEVPFTSRNWDNRLSEYIRLTDRLGIRTCGIWGGWSAQPPYKAEAPGLELAQQLGMGWLTNTPIAQMELGKTDQTDESLRKGVRNLIEQYGKVRPMIINLGNEPHGTGERVLKNVAAYRVVYEEVKKIDPSIPVVATSVEPNEEYFKAGYGEWCDAFDFHIYEESENVRRTIGEYRALMKKYGQEKPIWSTELGLNSQGQTRHAVATEVTRKFASFFAAGGTNVSWFGLLYPDGDGKLHGTSGDSHNVFDCRFNRYAPRLDAIAYYNAVNAIAIKKFVAEQHYPDGIHAFLFRDRDDRTLQILWKDKGRQDASIPLPGVRQVQLVQVDGRLRTLQADGRDLTLSITEVPLLLLYDGGERSLSTELKPPVLALESVSAAAARGGPISLAVTVKPEAGQTIEVSAPPLWVVEKTALAPGKGGLSSLRVILTPPTVSQVREANIAITLKNPNGDGRGELYVRCPVAE